MKYRPALTFAAFVWWLFAVPMDGPLLATIGIEGASRSFILPHALSLLLLGLFCPARYFDRLLPLAIGASIILTCLLFAWPTGAPLLLSALGITAAFATIQTGCLLRQATRPLLSGAIGLALANLLLVPFALLSPAGWPYAALATLATLALAPILLRPWSKDDSQPTAGLWIYLPFLFVFHIICGLMYGFLGPAYQAEAYIPGAELPFYAFAALAGLALAGRRRDLNLVLGILLGMIAFGLLQFPDPLTINLSMFVLQMGLGFIDLFLLGLLLAYAHSIRAFGLGLAAVCFGNAAGQFIGSHFAGLTEAIVLNGQIVLNVSALALYLLARQRHPLATTESPAQQRQRPPEPQIRIPENIRLLLSEREYFVLTRSLQGKNYRETAAELEVAESTVKTYMRRICDKLGATGKKDLLRLLAQD